VSDPALHHPVLCCPTVDAIRACVAPWRQAGERIALVPTMGALHEGHLSLVRQARRQAERVVVSIFVNPTQFAPSEDFSSYPRQLQRDLDLLATVGIDAVFIPDAGVMYPAGFATTISMSGPAAAGLEDASRPVFFNGVATVVAKLLIQVAQQLAVLKQLVLDLDLPVMVQGGPTMREADGLAMSSRNVYLSASERALAPGLSQAMQAVKTGLAAGGTAQALIRTAETELEQAGFRIDYLVLRDATTLGEWHSHSEGRLLVAVWMGKTRLIDNIAIDPVDPDGQIKE
jgi:pantoate--beta-alanine ligase